MLLYKRVLSSRRDSSRHCSDTPGTPGSRLKGLLLTLVALACLSFAGPAFALNSIDLDPASLTVNQGENFSIQLTMNFDEATVGGGLEVTYTTNVSFVSFEFNPSLTNTFGLSGPANSAPGQPLEIGFGFFTMSDPPGVSGSHVIGTFTFNALAVGPTQFITTASSALSPGPFYGPADPLVPMTVSFGSSAVTVVPEPSTAILMFLGLLGLGACGSAPKLRAARAAAKSND